MIRNPGRFLLDQHKYISEISTLKNDPIEIRGYAGLQRDSKK